MNRRITAIVLVLLMLVGTVSCGSRNVISYHNPRAKEKINYNEEPVTITYMTIGDKPTNGKTEEAIKKLNAILLKELNAKLDIYYIGWNDYLTNYNRALESEGAGIDLVGTGTDWLDAWPNAIKGNFLPLSEEMLRDCCGVTYTNVSRALWQSCSYDGKIYFIPENEYTQWINHGFIYRKDFAKEAGLEEVRSWADLDKYFESVIHNHPDVLPWNADGSSSIVTLGYLMSAMRYIPIYELTTYGIFGADQNDKEKIISPYYKGDELIEYARLMKKWNEMGVWREELSVSGDINDAFYSGEVSVLQHHTQNFYTIIKPSMKLSMPDTDVAFFWFGRESGNVVRESNLHGAMAVSAASQNPERALMVYDMIRNDETCYRLLRYGIEGDQYIITDSGMMEKPNGYNESNDTTVTNFWWGRRDEFELPDSSYSWDDYYDLLISYEHVAVNYPWEGVPFSTPTINKELEKIVKVCDEYIPQISSGKYEGTPEEKVAEFRYELMSAGIERVMGQLQRILDSQ